MDKVDAVVIGNDQTLTALKVAVASAHLRWNFEQDKVRTVQLISCCAEFDHYLDTVDGGFSVEAYRGRRIRTLGAGTICDAICNVTGVGQEPVNVGLPGVFMAECLRRPLEESGFGIDFDETAMVGSQ